MAPGVAARVSAGRPCSHRSIGSVYPTRVGRFPDEESTWAASDTGLLNVHNPHHTLARVTLGGAKTRTDRINVSPRNGWGSLPGYMRVARPSPSALAAVVNRDCRATPWIAVAAWETRRCQHEQT